MDDISVVAAPKLDNRVVSGWGHSSTEPHGYERVIPIGDLSRKTAGSALNALNSPHPGHFERHYAAIPLRSSCE